MSQIRFYIAGVDTPTEWLEESIIHGAQGEPTAVTVMSRLRPQYPSAAIRIERRGDVRIPNPVKMYRYRIVMDNVVGYTHPPVQEKDKAALLAKVRDEHPKAEITEEVI